MNVGSVVQKGGFFTKALYVRGVDGQELARRLGYSPSRLAAGWWLLFLLDLPRAEEFEVRGYTQMSGGVAQGHLPNPPDPRNAEQTLKDGGYDLPRIKANLIRDVFRLQGPERLAKVIPVAPGSEYPPGSGIPQWTFVQGIEKRFKVAAKIGPGQKYLGNYE